MQDLPIKGMTCETPPANRINSLHLELHEEMDINIFTNGSRWKRILDKDHLHLLLMR